MASTDKITVELTPEEIFVIQCGLEQIARIHDREYINVAQIANRLSGTLPKVDVKWDDVEYR